MTESIKFEQKNIFEFKKGGMTVHSALPHMFRVRFHNETGHIPVYIQGDAAFEAMSFEDRTDAIREAYRETPYAEKLPPLSLGVESIDLVPYDTPDTHDRSCILRHIVTKNSDNTTSIVRAPARYNILIILKTESGGGQTIMLNAPCGAAHTVNPLHDALRILDKIIKNLSPDDERELFRLIQDGKIPEDLFVDVVPDMLSNHPWAVAIHLNADEAANSPDAIHTTKPETRIFTTLTGNTGLDDRMFLEIEKNPSDSITPEQAMKEAFAQYGEKFRIYPPDEFSVVLRKRSDVPIRTDAVLLRHWTEIQNGVKTDVRGQDYRRVLILIKNEKNQLKPFLIRVPDYGENLAASMCRRLKAIAIQACAQTNQDNLTWSGVMDAFHVIDANLNIELVTDGNPTFDAVITVSDSMALTANID